MCRVGTASSSSRPTSRRSRRRATSCPPTSPTRSCSAPGRRDTGSWRGRRCSWCRPRGSPRGTWRSTRNHLTPALSARPRPVSDRSAWRDRGRRGRPIPGTGVVPDPVPVATPLSDLPVTPQRWSAAAAESHRPGRSHRPAADPPRPAVAPPAAPAVAAAWAPQESSAPPPDVSPQHSGWPAPPIVAAGPADVAMAEPVAMPIREPVVRAVIVVQAPDRGARSRPVRGRDAPRGPRHR